MKPKKNELIFSIIKPMTFISLKYEEKYMYFIAYNKTILTSEAGVDPSDTSVWRTHRKLLEKIYKVRVRQGI